MELTVILLIEPVKGEWVPLPVSQVGMLSSKEAKD
jgi:hypothetical protein